MISSITVTFQPDLPEFERQMKSLHSQVDKIIVIDNGSSTAILDALISICNKFDASIKSLEENTGIANAQNIGINIALNFNSKFLLLLDQDSRVMVGMVESLRTALERNPNAGAAGPQSIDQRTKHSSFLLDNGIWPRPWGPERDKPHPPIEVGFLISSGTLIRSSALDSPAPMLGDWFIDHVDSEWCLRVRSQGWKLLGVPDAHLMHRLGDEVSKVWFLRWRQVAHHSPLRDYYMFRNTILLVKKSYLPWRWRLFFLSRLFQYAGFFLILTPERRKRAHMMGIGVWDGFRGRTGPWK